MLLRVTAFLCRCALFLPAARRLGFLLCAVPVLRRQRRIVVLVSGRAPQTDSVIGISTRNATDWRAVLTVGTRVRLCLRKVGTRMMLIRHVASP